MKRFILIFGAVVIWASYAFASLPAVTASPNEQWRVEQNQSNPANTKTQLGTRLLGPLQTGATVVSTTSSNANTCGVAASNTAFASPFTKTYLQTLTSTAHGDYYCLGDGYQDETITFVLAATTASQAFTVTPATKTGFTNVKLTAAKAVVTFVYSDSTNGWVIQGTSPSGATIN